MKKYSGKGVYGAIAIGKISVLKKNDAAVTRVHVEDAAAEKARVEKAKQAAAEQLQAIHDKALKEVGEANAQIFEIHIMMLEDEDYNESIANIIDTQQVNAEYAVAVTSDNFAEMFAAMDDAYMQARSADVRDISNRIIANLTGTADSSAESCDSMIVCADDLAPSETVALDKDKVLAFVTAHGSSNSHTAILARNMNIPAVIGMGDEFLTEISSGTPAISSPLISISPEVGLFKRLIHLSRLDLPLPESPMITNISPSRTERLALFTATVHPVSFRSSLLLFPFFSILKALFLSEPKIKYKSLISILFLSIIL